MVYEQTVYVWVFLIGFYNLIPNGFKWYTHLLCWDKTINFLLEKKNHKCDLFHRSIVSFRQQSLRDTKFPLYA